MPKLPSFIPKKLIKILQQNSFYIKRQSGSHFILKNNE